MSKNEKKHNAMNNVDNETNVINADSVCLGGSEILVWLEREQHTP